MSHAECRACAHDPAHPCGFTPDILELMRPNKEREGAGRFTPSVLLGCARRSVLQSRVDYYEDVNQQWPRTRGSMVHAMLEKSEYPGHEVIRERRLEMTVETKYGPQRFTGKPDTIVLPNKIIDYKTTGKIELTAAKPDHIMQLNMYRLLAHSELGLDITELEIMYLSMSAVRRFSSATVLSEKRRKETVTLAQIPLPSYEQILSWVTKQIEKVLEGDEKLPPIWDKTDLCFFCPVRKTCEEFA